MTSQLGQLQLGDAQLGSTSGGGGGADQVLGSVLSITDSLFVEISVNVSSTLTVSDSVVLVGSFPVSLSQTLSLSDVATAQLFTGTIHQATASNALSITSTADVRRVRPVSIENTFVITDALLDDRIENFFDEISFAQDVQTQVIRLRRLSSSLSIYDSFVPIVVGDAKRYAPSIGASNNPSLPAPPAATLPSIQPAPGPVRSALLYPALSPSETIGLPAAEFGNTETITSNRVNRETRGGRLVVYADLSWPEIQALRLLFVGVKTGVKESVLTFLTAHLGEPVGFYDWEGRLWSGLILTPLQPVIENRPGRWDFSLEYEAELIESAAELTSVINITHEVTVTVV